MLFDGSAQNFVRHLAVPVKPETSSAIPSYRSLDDHTAAQKSSEDSFQGIQKHEHVKGKVDDKAPSSCPQHKRSHRLTIGEVCDSANNVDTDHLATIDRLPTELHLLIFDHVESIEDVVCLGLTSRYFWTIGRKYLHNYLASFLGQWAGQKLVCVGEDVDPGDLPPGLFSTDEADESRQRTIAIPYGHDYSGEGVFSPAPSPLAHFTFPSISDMEGDITLESKALAIFFACRERCTDRVDPAFEFARSDIWLTESSYLPEDHSWILRNLTTREFVRAEAIALKPEFIHGPHIDYVGFGEVLISRICWAVPSHLHMTDEVPLHISRGVWAGHCFDVTTTERHNQDEVVKGVAWKDVSEEVAAEIASIWGSEFGPKWREAVCKPWSPEECYR